MKYTTVIFDMDGTILDTLEDLTNSTNYVLGKEGFPLRKIDEVRHFVGNGIRKLIERAVPDGTDVNVIEKLFCDFMPHYKEHCADTTKPYDGIISLINELKESGCNVAVVSNKADAAVKELCEVYFPGVFECAIGERKGIHKKPAPDSVLEVLEQLGENDISKAVYIGDSEVDIQTAANAKMDSITVTWGFRDEAFLRENGAKVIISKPEEIKKIVLG